MKSEEDRVGKIVLDRRKHTCKGHRGIHGPPGIIQKGWVARAQGEKAEKWAAGGCGCVSLPGRVDEPLTTAKAQARPIRAEVSYRLEQGFRAARCLRCWIRGPRGEVGAAQNSGSSSTNTKMHHPIIDRESHHVLLTVSDAYHVSNR